MIASFLAAAALAKCFKPQAQYTYLVNEEVTKIYPKLVPGTRIRNAYIEDYRKVVPNYKGWLPAAVVKVNEVQLARCKAAGYVVIKGCDGSTYCVYPAPGAPVYIYVGNYTELLYELNATKGLGNKKARLWIVELLDPFCPYCSLFYKAGGGNVIEQMVRNGTAYLIPVVVAFHTNAPGFEESLRLAYQQNEYARSGDVEKFFKLEHEIVSNLIQLYQNKTRISNVNVTEKVLREHNAKMLKLAQKLFPYVATPGNVFVDTKTGKAIATMGALRPEGVKVIIKILYGTLK